MFRLRAHEIIKVWIDKTLVQKMGDRGWGARVFCGIIRSTQTDRGILLLPQKCTRMHVQELTFATTVLFLCQKNTHVPGTEVVPVIFMFYIPWYYYHGINFNSRLLIGVVWDIRIRIRTLYGRT